MLLLLLMVVFLFRRLVVVVATIVGSRAASMTVSVYGRGMGSVPRVVVSVVGRLWNIAWIAIRVVVESRIVITGIVPWVHSRGSALSVATATIATLSQRNPISHTSVYWKGLLILELIKLRGRYWLGKSHRVSTILLL